MIKKHNLPHYFIYDVLTPLTLFPADLLKISHIIVYELFSSTNETILFLLKLKLFFFFYRYANTCLS